MKKRVPRAASGEQSSEVPLLRERMRFEEGGHSRATPRRIQRSLRLPEAGPDVSAKLRLAAAEGLVSGLRCRASGGVGYRVRYLAGRRNRLFRRERCGASCGPERGRRRTRGESALFRARRGYRK